MKHRQQGVAILLLTSLILVLALVASMISYRTTFYQIKRAHNEVESRQQHWLAEGGLECAFAKVQIERDYSQLTTALSPAYFAAQCSTPLGAGDIEANASTIVGAPPGETYDFAVNARDDGHGAVHRKSFYLDDSMYAGALQTSADLYLNGDFWIYPDYGGLPDTNDKYDCTAMRFSNSLTYVSSGPSLRTEEPRDANVNCRVRSMITQDASVSGVPASGSVFKQDYKYQPSVDTFFNYFGIAKTDTNIANLKAGYHEVLVTDPADCGEKISTAFASHDKVWVEGNCYITGVPLNIVDAHISNPTQRSLVVKDSLFATHSAFIFDGSFIQFFHDAPYYDANSTGEKFNATTLGTEWDAMSMISTVDNYATGDTVYVDHGSFFPKGGIYFDAQTATVKMVASNKLFYSSVYKPHVTPKIPVWVKGSWDDR